MSHPGSRGPQTITRRVIILIQQFHPIDTSKRNKNSHTKSCAWKVIAALYIIVKKMEATEMSISWWMNEWTNEANSHSGELLSHRKAWNTDTRYKDDPWTLMTEASHRRRHNIWFRFYETPRIGVSLRDRKWICGCQARREGAGVTAKERGVSFRNDKAILQLTVVMGGLSSEYTKLLNCTLQMDELDGLWLSIKSFEKNQTRKLNLPQLNPSTFIQNIACPVSQRAHVNMKPQPLFTLLSLLSSRNAC